MIKRSSKLLIITISIAIALLCWEGDLSAQEKKDDKKWEITGYVGTAQHFYMPCVGMGLEYFLTPRISVEGELNYLPNIAYALPPRDWNPWGEFHVTFIGEDAKYRLLWDVNFLFYFDLTRIKRPTMRWFLTVGTGYQYDRVEYTIVSFTTQEQDKYGYGEFWFQNINFGIGYKINIKNDWALRILYKIHRPSDDTLTIRLALALSYRF